MLWQSLLVQLIRRYMQRKQGKIKDAKDIKDDEECDVDVVEECCNEDLEEINKDTRLYDEPCTFSESWIRLDVKYFVTNYGEDTTMYLILQRYIMYLISIYALISIACLLPINISEDFLEPFNLTSFKEGHFGGSTMSNINNI